MASSLILRDPGIWISGYSFAGESNEVSLDLSADTPENTKFGSEYRTMAPGGLKSSTFSAEGFMDELDTVAFDSLGDERGVMVIPGSHFAGSVAYIVPVSISGHNVGAAIGELVAFNYAATGDGAVVRAQTFDVRHNLSGSPRSTRQQLGAIPAGQTLNVWIHAKLAIGQTLRVQLRSASSSTANAGLETQTATITDTGLHIITLAGAVTNEWWELRYIMTGAGTFDIAAATFFQDQQAITAPPVPITPPTPGTVSLLGGLSADALPQAGELTIPAANHVLTFDPFATQHVLIARLTTEADVTSVVFAADATNQNQKGGFTKHPSTVTVAGDAYNVWVSNQTLTFVSTRMLEIA